MTDNDTDYRLNLKFTLVAVDGQKEDNDVSVAPRSTVRVPTWTYPYRSNPNPQNAMVTMTVLSATDFDYNSKEYSQPEESHRLDCPNGETPTTTTTEVTTTTTATTTTAAPRPNITAAPPVTAAKAVTTSPRSTMPSTTAAPETTVPAPTTTSTEAVTTTAATEPTPNTTEVAQQIAADSRSILVPSIASATAAEKEDNGSSRVAAGLLGLGALAAAGAGTAIYIRLRREM